MTALRRVVSILLFASGLAAPAAAQDGVELPAYAPALGDYAFRTEVRVTSEWRGDPDNPPTAASGAFDRALAIVSRGTETMEAVWRFDAAIPSDTPSPVGGAYTLNDQMQRIYRLYGLNELALETGPNGTPSRVLDWPTVRASILDSILARAGGGRDENDPVVREAMRELDRNPPQLAQTVMPEIETLNRVHQTTPRRAAVGESWTVARVEAINDAPVPVRMRWRLESVDRDRQTATLWFDETFDADALAAAHGDLLRSERERAMERDGLASAVRLLELSTATTTATGRAVVSLRDGGAIEVEETKTARLGGFHAGHVIRILRTR